MHDVIKPLVARNISEQKELRLAQISTAILGCAAIASALNFPSVLDLILYFQNISWVPLIMVPLYATILGLRADVRSFILSGICGFSSQFLWPVITGNRSELIICLVSLLSGAIGILVGHAIF